MCGGRESARVAVYSSGDGNGRQQYFSMIPGHLVIESRHPPTVERHSAGFRTFPLYPESAIRLSAQHLPFKALPVEFQSPPRPVILVNLRSRTFSPTVQLFISCVRELTKPLSQSR
jgi:hypothetical protein